MRRGFGLTVVLAASGALLVCSAIRAEDDIFTAVAKNDRSRVEELLKRNPKLANKSWYSKGDWNEGTPLHTAVTNGSCDMVKLLLAHKADPDASSFRGTPLELAALLGRRQIGDALIAHGARVDIWSAAGLNLTTQIETFLKAQPALVQGCKGDDRETPLHWAARAGQQEAVEVLLKHNADINAKDRLSQTPLHLAVEKQHLKVARTLLAHKANIKARARSEVVTTGISATVIDVPKGEKGPVRIHDETLEDVTPLHMAARTGNVEMVKLLIEFNAEVNAKEQDDATPLSEAIRLKHTTVADLLRRASGKK